MALQSRRAARIGCAVCAAALLSGPACKRPTAGTPVRLGAIAISPATGPDDPSSLVDRQMLTEQARAQLEKAGIFVALAPKGGQPGEATAAIRITLAMEPVRTADRAALRAVVRLIVATRPQGAAPPHFGEDVQANAEMLFDSGSATEGKAAYQRLAERTVSDLLATYIARQKLWSANLAAVHAALIAPSETRLEAIRVTAARKLVDQVPTLVTLLSNEDEEIRDAALGAMVELRDRRAVPALTKSKAMSDRREMRKIIDALATLGGQEAADYLSFVADAHEEDEVRRLAKAALERLQKQATTQSP
jgi:hypothetical protein